MAVLPLKTSVRGPAYPPEDPNTDDIVDEALVLFRPNSMFRNYEIYGAADRVLVYLILFISDCLQRIATNKSWSSNEAHKQLQSNAVDNFALPGDPGFPINSMYDAPANRQDSGSLLHLEISSSELTVVCGCRRSYALLSHSSKTRDGE